MTAFFKNDAEIAARYSAVENAKREIEAKVVELDGYAKKCADAGNYSWARSNQKSAVDLHCAVAIIEEAVFPHLHTHPGFIYGEDSCPGCERDDWLKRVKASHGKDASR